VKTRSGVVAAIAAIALSAVTLSGCGNIDAGSGAADDFERFMSEQKHIIGATGSGTNDLPWQGSPSGTVTVSADISADELETVVDMLGEYYVDHDRGNLDWKRMDVSVGAYELAVEKTKSTNDDLRALFEEIRENPRYTGGDIELREIRLEIDGEPSVDALERALDGSYDDLAAHFVEYVDIEGRPALTDAISVYFAEPGGSDQFTLQQFGEENRPDAEIAALRALWASVPLGFARVAENDFYAQTTDEADVPAADALVRGMLVGYEEGAIRIHGPDD